MKKRIIAYSLIGIVAFAGGVYSALAAGHSNKDTNDDAIFREHIRSTDMSRERSELRHGADDGVGHVRREDQRRERREDRRADRREDRGSEIEVSHRNRGERE